MRRNWEEVAKCSDYWTRCVVSFAEDPAILARLERGFPELFEEGEDDCEPRVPVTRLMELATTRALQEMGDHYDPTDTHTGLIYGINVLKEQGWNLPASFDWNNDSLSLKAGSEDKCVLARKIFSQLIGKKLRAGLVVDFEGARHLVINAWFETYEPRVDDIIAKHMADDLCMLELINTKHVVLDFGQNDPIAEE